MNLKTNKKKCIISIFILIFIIYIGTSIGSSNISMLDTISIIANKTFGITLRDGVLPKDVSIIWKIRLPRVLLAFKNGAVVTLGKDVIITGITIPVIGSFTLPFVGFIFGLFTVYLVILFSSKIDKTMSNNTIILAGMVFSLFVNALLTTLTAMFSEDLKRIALWQMGYERVDICRSNNTILFSWYDRHAYVH